MTRKLLLEYPGAIYHRMNRRDRREPIFSDDSYRQSILEILGQDCGKTDWQVDAFRLLSNQLHLVVETLQANRVDRRSEGRIPRELGVGQSGIAEKGPIRANRIRGKEFHRARCSDKVVLIHAIAADADGADQSAVPIERESAGENGDAIGQVRIRSDRWWIVGAEIDPVENVGDAQRQ